MEITKQTEEFLLGQKISNAHFFRTGRTPVISRNALLASLAEGKTILHLGCADHVELIEEKRKKGSYLHDILENNSKQLIGADTNYSAIRRMKELGIKNLYHPSEIPTGIKFDRVFVPDVIEHIGNLESFLLDLGKFNADEIVITTPNAFRLLNRKLYSGELVNTDHRYWFSPYTLSKNIFECGYNIKQFFYTDSYSKRHPIRNFLIWKYPLCRDGLAVIINKMT